MYIINDQKKCMASLAVFKQLYNSQKDIFSVISEFVKQEIISKNLTCFTEQEMHDFLLNDNGFDVPQAVIHTSIKKLSFLQRKNNAILVGEGLLSEDCEKFSKQMDEAEKKREFISERLIEFANSKLDNQLTKEQETDLCKSFYTYVVDDKAPVQYSELACAFILKNHDNQEMQENLNLIREGAISFLGLSYFNNTCGIVDKFDKDIYIYLETEILFHMAGYNGLTYKNLFDEFYSQVQEINKQHLQKTGKRVIHLRYFSETQKEIEDYFDQAENIVRRSKIADPSKSAMYTLTKGVSDPSGIADKRVTFEQLLKDHCIKIEAFDFDLYRDKGTYCLDYSSFVQDKDVLLSEKINTDLKLLNWIYIKRNRRPKESISNMGAVLLTGNYYVMQMAMDSKMKKPKELALSATLDFLTTRFWFSLCRGLSNDCNLLSAKVLTKARLALASLNNESIHKAYRKVEEEIKEKGYDKEKVKESIAALYSRFRMPEDIDDLTEKNNLAFFSDCRADVLLAEEAAKEDAHRKELESVSQKLEEKDKENEKKDEIIDKLLQEKVDDINKKEKKEYQVAKENYKNEMDQWIKQKMKNHRNKVMPCFCMFIFVLIMFFVVPMVVRYIPDGYSLLGIVLLAVHSVLNRISALKNNMITQGWDYMFKSKRNELRTEFESEYKSNNKEPLLNLTSLEELQNKYDRQ